MTSYKLIIVYCLFIYNFISKEFVFENAKPIINQELIDKIKYIRKDANLEDDKIFYFLTFFYKNDSSFVSISYDLSPPIFWDFKDSSFNKSSYDLGPPCLFSKDCLLGYVKYDRNNILIFLTEISTNVVSKFVKIEKLKKNIDELRHFPQPTMDGEVYEFYIDSSSKLVFIRKYFY
jgi:hypothetical protein